MKYLKKGYDGVHSFLLLITRFMLVAMVLITFAQVISRKLFSVSIRWSEEVPIILMIWFGFISMAIGVKERLHISIEVFYNLFPPKLKKVLMILIDILIAAIGLGMLYFGGMLAMKTMSSTMPATKMPTGFVYIILPISGFFIFVESVFNVNEDITEKNIDDINKNNNMEGEI